jgi:CheY-like chemotaxis protein
VYRQRTQIPHIGKFNHVLTSIQTRSGKLKILLAEDCGDDAYFFQRTLKKSSMECELTHVINGATAIEFLSQNGGNLIFPDILFLDLKMPVVSGFDVLEWIGRASHCCNLKVIVLSGSNDAADGQRARELGAADYVVKPISTDDLRMHLQALCPIQGRAQPIEF